MIVRLWHALLRMEKKTAAFHHQDLADELAEYEEAKGQGIIARWSEMADVVYTYTRGKYDGKVDDLHFPLLWYQYLIGSLYMYPKYTLRWLYFVYIGKKFGKVIHEVRNYKKIEKMHHIAEKYHIDPVAFVACAKKLSRIWPLIP